MRPRSRICLTLRGAALLALALVLWAGSSLTGLEAGRTIAAALLLALAVALGCVLLGGWRLRLERTLAQDAVVAGESVPATVRVGEGSLLRVLPLATGELRMRTTAAIDGPPPLLLEASMPHRLVIRRRGVHALGPLEVHLRDPFGLVRRRIRQVDDRRIVGLPCTEQLSDHAARRLGILRAGADRAAAASGAGDVGVIPRPYVPGDDIRRIHWRASARTGTLMTREEEPPETLSAVIILDTRAGEGPARTALEDRLVDHAASLLLALTARGWNARVLDATGDAIAESAGIAGGSSPLTAEAGALAARTALTALAGIGFEDPADASSLALRSPAAVGLVLALGMEDGSARADLDLDRVAVGATSRTAITLRPAGTSGLDRPGRTGGSSRPRGVGGRGSMGGAGDGGGAAGAGGVTAWRVGAWERISAPGDASLQQILDRAGEAAR